SLPTRTLPTSSSATASTMGDSCLHGPHQVAVKSTKTGSVDLSTSESKFRSLKTRTFGDDILCSPGRCGKRLARAACSACGRGQTCRLLNHSPRVRNYSDVGARAPSSVIRPSAQKEPQRRPRIRDARSLAESVDGCGRGRGARTVRDGGAARAL